MRKLWQEVETILVNSRLRLPIYIITIIFSVGFFGSAKSVYAN